MSKIGIFMADGCEEVNLSTLIDRIDNVDPSLTASTKRVEPLFRNREEYDEFKARHDKAKIKRKPLEECSGALFLGIDAGSTTTKAALIDKDQNLVYSYYRNNEGNPLEATKEILADLYGRNVQFLLVEGGARLIGSFMDEGLWDEARVETSPENLSAGVEAPRMCGGTLVSEEHVDGRTIQTFVHDM